MGQVTGQGRILTPEIKTFKDDYLLKKKWTSDTNISKPTYPETKSSEDVSFTPVQQDLPDKQDEVTQNTLTGELRVTTPEKLS